MYKQIQIEYDKETNKVQITLYTDGKLSDEQAKRSQTFIQELVALYIKENKLDTRQYNATIIPQK